MTPVVIIAGVVMLAIVAIVALFKYLNRATARVYARSTKRDVANALRNVLDEFDAHDHDEWDLFLCWPIDDPYLESIRQRCNDINRRWQGREVGIDLSREGQQEVRRILRELEEKRPECGWGRASDADADADAVESTHDP